MNGLVMSTLDLSPPRAGAEKPYWGDARAWELLAQVVDGKLSVQAACERHRMRREDVQEWLRGFHRSALIAFDDQLRRALIRQGATPEALGGPELSVSLSDISIVDWIQAIQLFAKHAVITVMHDASESRLWCSKGALIDAESGRLSGEAAVYRIVGLERGQVVTELRPVRRERTIRTSMQALLLEAARRKDEVAMLRRRLGDLGRSFQCAAVDASHRSINTAEAAVLRMFSGPRRLSDVLEESELGDVETLGALESLAAELASKLTPQLAALEPDLVVCDVLALGASMAAELLGVPWAQLSPHPLYEPSRALPPMGSGLAAGVGLRGKLRDSVLRAMTARSLRQGERQRAVVRQRIGLSARGAGPAVRLIATLPALEVPRPD